MVFYKAEGYITNIPVPVVGFIHFCFYTVRPRKPLIIQPMVIVFAG